jgi:hypothetical protein
MANFSQINLVKALTITEIVANLVRRFRHLTRLASQKSACSRRASRLISYRIIRSWRRRLPHRLRLSSLLNSNIKPRRSIRFYRRVASPTRPWRLRLLRSRRPISPIYWIPCRVNDPRGRMWKPGVSEMSRKIIIRLFRIRKLENLSK